MLVKRQHGDARSTACLKATDASQRLMKQRVAPNQSCYSLQPLSLGVNISAEHPDHKISTGRAAD